MALLLKDYSVFLKFSRLFLDEALQLQINSRKENGHNNIYPIISLLAVNDVICLQKQHKNICRILTFLFTKNNIIFL